MVEMRRHRGFTSLRPPKTLTADEQRRLLAFVAESGHRRDSALLSLALGTGLRLMEVVGLDVGHVVSKAGEVAWRVDLPKGITKHRRGGVAFLPERVRDELALFLAWKRSAGQSLDRRAPLFLSSQRRRIGTRRAQSLFQEWQRRAGFEEIYTFHHLRHTAITNVYRATKDLYLAQRFARHANPITTVAYTHASDEEMYEKIAGI
jgi:site-specific recombinase XerC